MTASFDPATGMRLVTLAILCLMPRPAFAQGSIDSNEVAVLRVVLQRQGNDTSIVVGSAPDTTAVCNDGSERTCIPASLAPAYASAIENYAHRNRSGPAPDALLRTLGRPIFHTMQTDPKAPCAGPRYVSFSRVGFDVAFEHAVVQVESSRGRGPFPGCGWASGETLLLRREPSGWAVAARIDSWIT